MAGDHPNDDESNGESADASSTSRSLLLRLKDDDAEAWDRLVSLYTPLVYYWCQKQRLSEQDIPDVVQDVFRAVASNIGRFRKDRPGDTFRGWLRTITRSKATDHFRKQQKQPNAVGGSVAQQRFAEVPDFEDDDSVDEPAVQSLFLRALDLIKEDFHDQTWQAFWGVVVDGKQAKDIAEELSMRPGTVRVAKSRVLQRLRQELGDVID